MRRLTSLHRPPMRSSRSAAGKFMGEFPWDVRIVTSKDRRVPTGAQAAQAADAPWRSSVSRLSGQWPLCGLGHSLGNVDPSPPVGCDVCHCNMFRARGFLVISTHSPVRSLPRCGRRPSWFAACADSIVYHRHRASRLSRCHNSFSVPQPPVSQGRRSTLLLSFQEAERRLAAIAMQYPKLAASAC